jgi:RNA polymerase sigma-70 factor (sigma-E family)
MRMTVPEYDEVYAALWPRLVRTAYAVSGDRGVAEDSVQSALAKACRSWRRISRLESPEAYVRRMVVNEVLSTRRRAALRHEVSRAEPPDRVATATPEDALAHDEMWRALSTLPPRQRAVLVLRYYEDLSEQQIADALGCRPGTVKSQASAALATLRARLGQPTVAPTGGEQA